MAYKSIIERDILPIPLNAIKNNTKYANMAIFGKKSTTLWLKEKFSASLKLKKLFN